MLLLHENATVTICHSKTEHLAGVCRQGDILVAALGRPAALTSDFIRPGATVVDVGTTRITDREQAARIFRQSPEKLEAFDRKGRMHTVIERLPAFVVTHPQLGLVGAAAAAANM